MRASAIRSFERSLPMLLLRSREAVMSYFRPLLSEYGLTEQQFRVIRAVHAAREIEVGALADRCSILPASMTGILKRLQARGLVERHGTTEDRRRSLVRLTPDAVCLLVEIGPHSEERYAEIERRFGTERTEQLYRLLGELEAALTRPATTSGPDRESR